MLHPLVHYNTSKLAQQPGLLQSRLASPKNLISNREVEHPQMQNGPGGTRFASEDARSSTLQRPYQQQYSVRFNGTEFFLKDHQVQGQKVLPGVAYLEMARAAGELAGAGKTLTQLKNVVWPRPLIVKNEPVETQLNLRPAETDELIFEVSTVDAEGQPVVHAQGRLAYRQDNEPSEPPLVDLAAIRQRCPQQQSGTACYQFFSHQGLQYGPGFQAIEEMVSNAEEALARLRLPVSVAADWAAYRLHPSLLDGALQSAVGLIEVSSPPEARLYLPFELAELELLGPLSTTSYVYVKRGEVHQDTLHFNLAVLDDQGRVCLKLKEFVVKAVPHVTALTRSEPALYYQPYWQPQPLSDQAEHLSAPSRSVTGEARGGSEPKAPCGRTPPQAKSKGDILLVTSQTQPHLGDRIAQAHPQQRVHRLVLGHRNVRLSETTWEINLADPEGLASLSAALTNVATLYFLAGLSAVEPELTDLAALEQRQEQGVISLFRLLKGLVGPGLLPGLTRLKVLTQQAHQVHSQDHLQPWSAALVGLTMSLAREYPALEVSCLDVILQSDSKGQITLDEGDVAAIMAESGSHGQPIALRAGVRYVRRLAAVSLPELATLPYRPGGVYLILGGAGGIGLETAVSLARQTQARVVLVGRSALTPEKETHLNRIREAGGDYLYCQADGADLEAMQAVVHKAKATFGPLNGVIHSALVLKDATLSSMAEATFRAALEPKIKASVVLYQVVKDEPLDFMLFFSSVLSFWGNAGQSNYSAGCTFKDAFALSLTQTCPFPVKIINWGYWGYVGAVASESYRRRLSRQGIHSIAVEEGMAALSRILAGPVEQVAMLKVEPQALKELGIEFERRVEVLASRSRPMLNGLLERMKVEVEGLLA
jgi:NAD(P)-dependent dehydrogenase (short-subunit alcohol dehydrogenase family)